MDIDEKIREISSKIEIEKKCKDGAQNLLSKLLDRNAIQQCEMTLLESQKRLDFLEDQLRRLYIKKERPGGSMEERSMSAKNDGSAGQYSNMYTSRPTPSKRLSDPTPPNIYNSGYSLANVSHNSSINNAGSGHASHKNTLSYHPSSSVGPGVNFGSSTAAVLDRMLGALGVKNSRAASGTNTPKSSASSTSSLQSLNTFDHGSAYKMPLGPLDFLRSDSPITTEKVKYKLEEIKYKLDVEQKVKAGMEKIVQVLHTTPGSDRRRLQEVEEKLYESQAKVSILIKARQRYKSLNIVEDTDDHDPASPDDDHHHHGRTTSRRPLSGRLKIRLMAATGLPNKKSHRSDIYAVIKVDGVQKAKTKYSKSKWAEDFDIYVEKAQEVELCVAEKGGTVLSLVWFKLAELEEMANAANSARSQSTSDTHIYSHGLSSGGLPVTSSMGAHKGGAEFGNGSAHQVHDAPEVSSPTSNGMTPFSFDTWLDMEPAGQLAVRLSFIADLNQRKKRSEGVARRRPVQKVFPKQGHKFIAMQFYQVMKCAVCSEFLISGQGYQCQACKYTCHKRCQSRVISKCITKADLEKEEEDSSDQLLRHRIPHRFEPTTNLGAFWCCHCGSMLPLGKRQGMRCSECSATAHKECMHLVPNLCGLSTALMDQMKQVIDQAERTKREKDVMRSEQARLQQQREREEHERAEQEAAMAALREQQAIEQQQQHQRQQQLMAAAVTSQQIAPLPITYSGSTQIEPHQPQVPARELLPPPQRPVITGRTTSAGAPRSTPRGIGLDDFNFLAVLGKGNFGKVMLAEEKISKQLYAIKVLKKEFIIENDEVESTKSEKRVFMTANLERHPFLVNLHSCFQTESRIYFVMEYVSGGDLMWHIQHQQFSEKRAKFYACEVLLALEYFHKNNIVYRDLKLDNILLSLEGHIKIADYGLCKENMPYGSTTTTFCGTPEFMAPEILLEKPYGRAVDWWALGVLIYEMLLGQSPFKGDDEDQIFEAILEDEVLYPVNMAKDAVSLLQKLLTKDPLKRLGSGKTDSEEIKRHPYFKGVIWEDVLIKKNPPPFYPSITSPTDVSNFDEEFTKEMPVLTPCNSVLSAADQEEFRGFTYIR
ncbi:Serine/threonine kinase [Dinochytrium kinnereticum]|nr:Serine/threonine kinase [Dinochytrium kinnereticum]